MAVRVAQSWGAMKWAAQVAEAAVARVAQVLVKAEQVKEGTAAAVAAVTAATGREASCWEAERWVVMAAACWKLEGG